MSPILENEERRKRRDPEIMVWDFVVRSAHWLLALTFATLYLEYKKFPLHPYAGYLLLGIVVFRIIWGFIGAGAARFSSFRFSPKQMLRYLKSALQGHAEYHFSHNPMGAAMVYALLGGLLANSILGLLTYSATQQLGPFGNMVPEEWEDYLVATHTILGHLTAVLVILHLAGVLWASRLHRENYALSMLTGIRRIPRAVTIPDGALRAIRRTIGNNLNTRIKTWLNYRHPFLGSLIIMAVLIAGIALPIIHLLVRLNKFLPAY